MGADRKGPLAAFVVIAIIAAILLVTSVRSQAEPTIVAAPPTLGDPDLWGSVSDNVWQAIEAGVTLVHKATSDPTGVRDPGVSTAAGSAVDTGARTDSTVASGSSGSSGNGAPSSPHIRARQSVHRAIQVVRHAPAQPTSHPVNPQPSTTPAPSSPEHGRHLGWGHGTHASHASQVSHRGHASHGSHAHGHGKHLGWAKHGSHGAHGS